MPAAWSGTKRGRTPTWRSTANWWPLRSSLLLHERGGLPCKIQYPGGEHAECQSTERRQNECHTQPRRQRFGALCCFRRLVHVHHYQNPQVVVGGDRTVQQAEHAQPDQVRLDCRAEDIELAE